MLEPDPAIPNAMLGVCVKKGVLSEVLPSPSHSSISTPTVNKDVKQTLQFAFIVLLREKNPVKFFFTSEALFTDTELPSKSEHCFKLIKHAVRVHLE